MQFQEALDYLYEKLPIYQRIGPPAIKKDLSNTNYLCKERGDPHRKFKSIHIAGTNGKGSSSHMLASILQEAGFKSGLYTSPHLKSFTERIKINGQPISEYRVVSMVENYKTLIEEIKPSFFEVTVVMAFEYFAEEKVDFGIFEVGLGGRLDSTNILLPEISLITNISFDHQDMLGDTLEKIANEKAGIIKPGVPVVIGTNQEEIKHVFDLKAEKESSLIDFAHEYYKVNILKSKIRHMTLEVIARKEKRSRQFGLDAAGHYQVKNLPGVLRVVDLLNDKGYKIDEEALVDGLKNFQQRTGLKGRWQVLSEQPVVIADVAHNEAGIKEVLSQLLPCQAEKFHFVLGFVKGKDLKKIIPLFPQEGNYYFCQANVPRAMDARLIAHEGRLYGLKGEVIFDVNEALRTALSNADDNDIIYVGGSTFVVSELENL